MSYAHYVASFSIPQEECDTGWEYAVRLDNRMELTGVYDAATGRTTWTFASGYDGIPVDTAVLGPDFGDDAGESITVTPSSATTVYATGDYSAGECMLGLKYTLVAELSKPYMRDRDGSAILDAVLQLVKVVTNHQTSGPYTIRVVQPLSRSRDVTFTPSGLTEEEGKKQAIILGNAKDSDVSLRATGPRPVSIATAEYEVQFNKLSR